MGGSGPTKSGSGHKDGDSTNIISLVEWSGALIEDPTDIVSLVEWSGALVEDPTDIVSLVEWSGALIEDLVLVLPGLPLLLPGYLLHRANQLRNPAKSGTQKVKNPPKFCSAPAPSLNI